ncbi:hypothetical protein KBD20_00245 [Candidatus Saccharibacteria bacterium]|nr:hypothetical protein [Candidatus Saccharibacteria bacterium]
MEHTQVQPVGERQIVIFEQQAMLAELDFEAALAEDNRRRALGQKVIFMAFGLNGADDLQLFKRESRGKIRIDDEVGPVILQQESDSPVRGVAVWRHPESSRSKERQHSLRLEKRVCDPLPQSMVNDQRIRESMAEVLSWDNEKITIATKQMLEDEMKAIHSVELSLPIRLPSICSEGTHNKLLKDFAFDAFDALHEYYGSPEEWGEWAIIPYFAAGDDMFEVVTLGVFITESSASNSQENV